MAVGSFIPLEGLIGPYLAQCARYMETPRAIVAGLAKAARECQTEMRWGWIVMHPNYPEEFVDPSRSMLCRHPQMHYEIIEFVDSGKISRLRWKHGLDTQFFSVTGNTSEIATLQRHIKGIGALKSRYAEWVYTDDLPMPPWDCVCKAEFWTSSKYVDFRSHLAGPRNFFDIASSEGNVVHLKTVSGSGADASGGESPFRLCLLNPTTIPNATVVRLLFILVVIEVPKGWSMGLPPLAVRHVSMGKPLVVAGELADVRIIMSQMQTDLAEEGVNQVSVMVYNTGSRIPNFTMMQSLMTIVMLTPIPRKIHCPL